MLLNTYAIQKWNSKNKTYYINKEYVFTTMGDEFQVNIEDLTPNSKAVVEVKCDYCGIIVKKNYQTYLKQHHDKFGDACKYCQPQKNKLCCLEAYGVDNVMKDKQVAQKVKNTCLQIYGVDNASKSDEVKQKIVNSNREKYGCDYSWQNNDVKNKIKETSLKKYGCAYPSQSEEVKNKIKITNLDRYGFDVPSKNPLVKEKVKQTNIKKFGVSNYSMTEECKDKIKATNLQKYGYEYVLQVPEIREKISNSLLNNGTCKTSKQQLELFNLLNEMYGNCKLNLPCGCNSLDCVVDIDGVKIDIEYDGWYWHQDEQRDRRRDEYVKSCGYKILRIVGEKNIPTKQELKEAIDKLVLTEYKFYKINMV